MESWKTHKPCKLKSIWYLCVEKNYSLCSYVGLEKHFWKIHQPCEGTGYIWIMKHCFKDSSFCFKVYLCKTVMCNQMWKYLQSPGSECLSEWESIDCGK